MYGSAGQSYLVCKSCSGMDNLDLSGRILETRSIATETMGGKCYDRYL